MLQAVSDEFCESSKSGKSETDAFEASAAREVTLVDQEEGLRRRGIGQKI